MKQRKFSTLTNVGQQWAEGGRKEHRKYNGQEVTAGADDGMMTNLPAIMRSIKPLTPNDPYRGRTAPLTSNVAFYIFLQQI